MRILKITFCLIFTFTLSKSQDPGVNVEVRMLYNYFFSLKDGNSARISDVKNSPEKITALSVNDDTELQLFLNDIKKYSNIKYLSIAFTGIKRLPLELLDFKKLECLDLTGNNELNFDSTFSDLKRLSSLRALEISVMKKIPDPISLSDSVIYLMLESNGLERIPSSVFKLSHLKGLNLRANNIKEIPIEIYQMPALEELLLGDNEKLAFQDKGYDLRKSNVKRIDLTSCNIKKFPDQLIKIEGIEILNLTFNKLKCLNRSLATESALQVLILDSNPLDSVDTEFFNPFYNMKYVSFWRCPLAPEDRKTLIEKYPKIIFED